MTAPLDDPATYPAIDPRGFRELLRGFAGQLSEASGLADAVVVGRGGPWTPRAVVLLGMGGSAVAGDFLQALCETRAPFPVVVVRGYTVPAWVGPDSLVIASSYSGQTEETLSAFDAARARGARLVAVTSGGRLGDAARRDGHPWIRVPGGFPPRAALAFLLMPLVVLLEGAGAHLGGESEREEAVSVLKGVGGDLAPEVPATENPAKALAAALADRVPVVYGTDATGPVAYRWRTQFEENAKVLALSGVLPEMNHNAIEAWGGGVGGQWTAVFLRDRGEHPRVARRVALTRDVIGARAPVHEAWSRGDGRLARLLSLALTGDWVSYYLAVLRGVDAWAVETLEGFKRRMAEGEPPP